MSTGQSFDDLLRKLGADPDNPPPKPTLIDIPFEKIPEALRGCGVFCVGNMAKRVSFKFDGVRPEATRPLTELVEGGTVVTMEDMLFALPTVQIAS